MPALREVVAEFGVKLDQASVARADSAISGLVNGVKSFAAAAIATVGVNAIKGFVLDLVDQADALGDTSAALGVNAQTLQSWRYAAERAGGSGDAVVGALAKIQKQVKESPEGFKDLGIEVKNSQGELKGAAELFEEAAGKIADIQNPTEQAAAASKIFGRSFLEIIPLLKQGSAGIAKLRERFDELGGGFDDDFIEKAGEIDDQLKDLAVSSLSLKVALASKLLPVVKTLFNYALRADHAIQDWVKNTNVLKTAALAAAIFGVAKLSSVIGPLVVSAYDLGRALRKIALPAALIAAFLFIEDFLTFLEGGDSLIGRALDSIFGPGTQEKVRAFALAVGDAVKAFNLNTLREFFSFLTTNARKAGGDFSELWQTVGQTGTVLLGMLTGGWDNFWRKLGALIDAGAFSFKVVWDDITNLGLYAAAALSDAWDGVWNGLISGAEGALSAVADILAKVPGAGDLAKSLQGASQGLEGSKNAGDARETVDAAARRQQKQRLAEGENIMDRLGIGAPTVGPGGVVAGVANATAAVPVPPVNRTTVDARSTITNKTTVTVPPGTPAEQANAVGRAAEAGASKGSTDFRAAQAALVHTAD